MRAMFSIFALLTIINGSLFGICVFFINVCPLKFLAFVAFAFSISLWMMFHFLKKLEDAHTKQKDQVER